MSSLILAKRFPLALFRPRVSGALRTIAEGRKALRRRSRQEIQADAIVDRFGSDRWSDVIEREISIRVR
jgi:hypothetical protein